MDIADVKLERKEYRRKLVSVVLPIAFQSFMLSAVSASDALMLGFLDQDSMAAVSLAGQVAFVLSILYSTMTMGTGIFAAQYWGKGDRATVEMLFGYVMRITTAIALVFTAAAFAIPEWLMRIFTNEPALIEKGAVYLRWVALSYLLSGITQMYLAIFKNSDRALTSTIISSVAVVLNIAANAVLIFGWLGLPAMGVAGAALATVIARVVEFVLCLAFTAKGGAVKLRMRHLLRTAKTLSGDFWRYTLPVLGNMLAWGVGFTMYSVIMGHLGSDATAANSIAAITKNLIACFCNGLATGAGIIVGNELGRGALDKARRYGSMLCRSALLIGAVSGLVVLAVAPIVLRVVNLTDTAQGYLLWMLVICSYNMIGMSINMTVISGIFTCGGDTKFGVICDVITMWVYAVPVGLIAAFVLDLPVLAVYFLLNLDELVKLPAVYRHYKKYRWVKDLTRDEVAI